MYQKKDQFALIITPEGTRSANPNWKLGFHHIARSAEVPILMVYVDSASKTIGIENLFNPTQNIDEDIKQIKAFYDYIKKFSGIKMKNVNDLKFHLATHL